MTKRQGNHQDDLVYEICKTSIPGSNPVGACKIIQETFAEDRDTVP
jgi:hypothetical protein